MLGFALRQPFSAGATLTNHCDFERYGNMHIAILRSFVRQFRFVFLMTRLKYLLFLVFALTTLEGCRWGYVMEPAILNIAGLTNESSEQLSSVVSHFLKQEGFEDLGKYNEMISLIEKGNMSEDTKAEQLARLNRERNFLNRDKHLRIVWVDYINKEPPKGYLSYTPSSKQFIEINIYEEQPDGFSLYGRNFYIRFISTLRKHYGTSIVVVNEPPPNSKMN
ncbi:MAG: hypothetical protein V4447_07665 [Pseudomonadota bacterium]